MGADNNKKSWIGNLTDAVVTAVSTATSSIVPKKSAPEEENPKFHIGGMNVTITTGAGQRRAHYFVKPEGRGQAIYKVLHELILAELRSNDEHMVDAQVQGNNLRITAFESMEGNPKKPFVKLDALKAVCKTLGDKCPDERSLVALKNEINKKTVTLASTEPQESPTAWQDEVVLKPHVDYMTAVMDTLNEAKIPISVEAQLRVRQSLMSVSKLRPEVQNSRFYFETAGLALKKEGIVFPEKELLTKFMQIPSPKQTGPGV